MRRGIGRGQVGEKLNEVRDRERSLSWKEKPAM